MNTLVNAMVLAEYYNAEFRFHWVKAEVAGWHGMQSAESIFSKDFIDRYWIDRSEIGNVLSIRQFLSSRKNSAGSPDDAVHIVEPHWFLPQKWIQNAGPDVVREALSRNFRNVGFTEHLSKILELADNVVFPPHMAGIHLRAGDVIYGPERFTQKYYGKATPYQLASHYLRERHEKGLSTVVFGQDEPLCRALASAHGAFWVGNLRPQGDFSALEYELIDIALISRCEEVIGGSSAFLHAGAVRGGIELKTITDVYDQGRRKSIIMENKVPAAVEAAASNTQKAFSLWCVAWEMMEGNGDNIAEVLPIIEEALEYDPDNGFLHLVRAYLLILGGSVNEAESSLASAAGSESGSLLFMLGFRFKKSDRTPANSPISQVCRSLFSRGDKTIPWANACAAIHLGVASAQEAELARDALTRIPDMPEAWRSRLMAELETAKSIVPTEETAAAAAPARKARALHNQSKPTGKQPWSMASPIRWLTRMVKRSG